MQHNPVDPILHRDKGNEISCAWVWLLFVTCPLQIECAQLLGAELSCDKSPQWGERGLLGEVTEFTEWRTQGKSTSKWQRKWHKMSRISDDFQKELPFSHALGQMSSFLGHIVILRNLSLFLSFYTWILFFTLPIIFSNDVRESKTSPEHVALCG